MGIINSERLRTSTRGFLPRLDPNHDGYGDLIQSFAKQGIPRGLNSGDSRVERALADGLEQYHENITARTASFVRMMKKFDGSYYIHPWMKRIIARILSNEVFPDYIDKENDEVIEIRAWLRSLDDSQ